MQKVCLSLAVSIMICVVGCSFESGLYEQPEPGVRCQPTQIDSKFGDEKAMIRCWLNSRPDHDVNFIPSTPNGSIYVYPEYVTITPDYWDSEIRFYTICLDDGTEGDVSLKVESIDGNYYGTQLKDVHVTCGKTKSEQ